MGEGVQFRAIGTLTDGTTRDVTRAVTWTSSNPAVATITSSSGLATAIAPGSSIITAAYPGDLAVNTSLTVVMFLPPTIDSVIPNTGQAGTTVTLVGVHMGGAIQVAFNGTAASFIVQSTTQITATVPMGATSGPITVTTPGGMTASPGSFSVAVPPTVTITAPADGATINATNVQVRGTVASSMREVGVSVNGVPAQVNGAQWVVEVPLEVGSNVLTATALDTTGAQATASITVTVAQATPASLQLRAVPESGVAPLVVRWQVENMTGRALVLFELDERGTGTYNPPVATLDGVETTYTTPGLLHPVLRATDDQANQHTATAPINVLAREQMDAMLQEKWYGLRAALKANAIEVALGYFTPEQQPRFRTLLTALSDQLGQIAEDLQEIQLIYLVEHRAKYRLQRTRFYGGQQVTFTYYVYFIQDAAGFWTIEGF